MPVALSFTFSLAPCLYLLSYCWVLPTRFVSHYRRCASFHRRRHHRCRLRQSERCSVTLCSAVRWCTNSSAHFGAIAIARRLQLSGRVSVQARQWAEVAMDKTPSQPYCVDILPLPFVVTCNTMKHTETHQPPGASLWLPQMSTETLTRHINLSFLFPYFTETFQLFTRYVITFHQLIIDI